MLLLNELDNKRKMGNMKLHVGYYEKQLNKQLCRNTFACFLKVYKEHR